MASLHGREGPLRSSHAANLNERRRSGECWTCAGGSLPKCRTAFVKGAGQLMRRLADKLDYKAPA